MTNDSKFTSPGGLDALLERQRGTARIAGALAHELNSPLQGLFSLLGIFSRESTRDEKSQLRLEQMRSGLTRLSRIVESFATAYEHIPRPPDRVNVSLFKEHFLSAFAERQLSVTIRVTAPDDTRFFCMMPETMRLVSEAFSLPSPEYRPLEATLQSADGRIELLCGEKTEDGSDVPAWKTLADPEASSSLSVLIDEMTKFAGGQAEFLFNHSSLCGIRLVYEVV